MEKIRIGIIGSGFIAEHHLNAYLAIPQVEIVGICSLLEEEAKMLIQKYKINCEIYQDYKRFLDLEFDAVSICLPNYLHNEVAIKALNSGKHVMIEKPLARTVAEGQGILKAAEENAKQVFYCENNMYAPAFRKLKQLIEEGAVGQIYMARGKEQHSGPHSKWFYKKDSAGGGALLDLGIHDIACLVWFLESKVERVFCQTKIIQSNRGKFGECEVDDSTIGILYFENGAQVTIEESWCAPGGYDMKFEIYGTEGQIIADPCRMTPLNVYSENGYGYAVEKASSTAGWTYPVPEEAWTFGYPQEIQHFIKCIKNNEKPLTNGEFGLQILKIIETMYKSAQSGQIESI